MRWLRVHSLGIVRAGWVALMASACSVDRVPFSMESSVAEREASGARNPASGRWLVELTAPPVADGGSLSAARTQKEAFRRGAAMTGISFQEHRAYDTLFNGLSITVDPADVALVRSMKTVKALHPVLEMENGLASADPDDPELELATAHLQTGVDIAHDLGFSGAGVKIGIIDTGIHYEHPDLGGCFGDGCKVSGGYDFVDDDPDPHDDCFFPHGTAVAGVAAASGDPSSGGALGVAHGAEVYAYRAGCASVETDLVLAAMERALEDELPIVNLSFGKPFTWSDGPIPQAADRMAQSGVVVVATAGNRAPGTGLYALSAVGGARNVIGVTGANNTHYNLPAFTLSPDAAPVGYYACLDCVAIPTSGTLAIETPASLGVTWDGCSFPSGSLEGAAVLIPDPWPSCTALYTAAYAQLGGASAVILYNPGGNYHPTVGDGPSIPVVLVDNLDAQEILARLDSGGVTMTWTPDVLSFPNPADPQFGTIYHLAAWGPTPNLLAKPNVAAPAWRLRVPWNDPDYVSSAGSSLAAPYIAGAAALLLESRPNMSPAAIRAALANTAEPVPWSSLPALGLLEQVHRQGAGLVRVDKALSTPARVEPSSLALGESEHGPAQRTLEVTNDGLVDLTYQLSHVSALGTGPDTFAITHRSDPAGVVFSADSITVPAGVTASVDVTITAPDLPSGSLYGGYVVFTPEGGGPALRVRFMGLCGDYQSLPVIGREVDLPWLRKWENGDLVTQSDGASYTLSDGDHPVIWFALLHQSERLRVVVRDRDTGQNLGRAFADWDHAPRSRSPFHVFTDEWTGEVMNGGGQAERVPMGAYRFEYQATKALGDADEPGHLDTWTSPWFEIWAPVWAPEAVFGSGTAGEVEIPVEVGFTGPYAAEWAGLVPSSNTFDSVDDDPANSFFQSYLTCDLSTSPPSDCTGMTWHLLPGGEGLLRRLLLVGAEAADDIDLYVFDTSWNYYGASATPSHVEQVDVVLPDIPGQLLVAVHGWGVDGADAPYTLYDWHVSGDAGNAQLSGAPTDVEEGDAFTLTVEWTGLTPGQFYLGAVHHDDGVNPPVELTTVSVFP